MDQQDLPANSDDRSLRTLRAEEFADTARPCSSCVHHDVALERRVRRDEDMPAARRDRGVDELARGEDRRTPFPEQVGEQTAVDMAVERAVARAEEPAGQVAALEVRDDPR
jgi:hypothetical protein